MNPKIQQKVLHLFDEGRLPQQIADALAISMHEVVGALKARLRLDDDEVDQFANDEILKQRAVAALSERLRVVDQPTASSAQGPALAAPKPTPPSEPAPEQSPAIAREREPELRDLIRANLTLLEPGLTLAAGGPPVAGDSGPAGIHATDRAGVRVIIEATTQAASAELLVRLLALMGAHQQHPAGPVRGILIANRFSQELTAAARAVPNVELRTYRVTVAFGDP